MSEVPSSILDEEQRDLAYPPGTEFHFWNQSRCHILFDKLPPLDPDALVIDVGCGPGATVKYLRAKGLDAIGCDLAAYREPDPELAPHVHYAQDAFDLPVETRRRVKLVLLLDVLEHMEDPESFLSRCIEGFENLEHVLLMMPARSELWTGFDDYYGHVRRYDGPSLRALCGEARLEISAMGYCFHGLYLAVGASKLLWRSRTIGVKPIAHHWAHGLLARLFHLEEKLLPGSLPGTTIWATTSVASRSARSERDQPSR